MKVFVLFTLKELAVLQVDGGWLIGHMPLGCRNHRVKLPPSTHKDLRLTWRNARSVFLKRLFPILLFPHPILSNTSPAFPQNRVYGPCKNTLEPLHSTITIIYQMSPEHYLT